MAVELVHGDCLEVLAAMHAAGRTVDSICTDPPYHLTTIGRSLQLSKNGDGSDRTHQRNYIDRGFMGKAWDGGDIAMRPETWRLALDVLPPGGHMAVFGGSRTHHRMACAIEDAGFELREMLFWLYGSGFPKSLDVSKAIDKAAGAEREVLAEGKAVKRMIPGADQNKTGSWVKDNGREFVPTVTAPATPEARQWAGFGTALKPAVEPIILARKPLIGSVAANVLAHGTGALNIDACRVPGQAQPFGNGTGRHGGQFGGGGESSHSRGAWVPTAEGRWPANILHDGSDEVLDAFAAFGERKVNKPSSRGASGHTGIYGHKGAQKDIPYYLDTGSAARFYPALGYGDDDRRFFYCAKASRRERMGTTHPTTKPLALISWLTRLITPPGGTVLDPFAGSGTTGLACAREGFDCVLVEREAEYVAMARKRLGIDFQLEAAD